jgi:acyl carrier protein
MTTNEARDVILKFLEDTFNFSFSKNDVTDTDNLFECGYIDSFGLVQIISFIETTFDTTLPVELLTSGQLGTLAGMVSLVESKKFDGN